MINNRDNRNVRVEGNCVKNLFFIILNQLSLT